MTRNVLCGIAALAGCSSAALAQWSDNFDSYPSNVNINGLGGWQGWDNSPAQAPITSNAIASSAPNSILVSGLATGTTYSDNVHQYSGYTTGQWRYSADLFIPANATGDAYFILLNKYADGTHVNGDWSVELKIDGTANNITDDFDGIAAPQSRVGSPLPLVRGSWVPVRVDFDLVANTVQTFFNNALVSSGTWKTANTSTLTFQAVDLFSNASTGVYFDNITLAQIPAPGAAGVLALGGLLAARRRRA